jgi:hypothetical protein
MNRLGLGPFSEAFASLAGRARYGTYKLETIMFAVVFSSGSASGESSLTRLDTFGLMP